MAAWEAIQRGEPNPLAELLAADEVISSYLAPHEIRAIIARGAGVGDAPERSRELARRIREAVASRHR
jgi:adenylosuccinate lyase